jgi:hypothetical protein
MPAREPPGPVWRRLLWFAGLWALGVAAAAAAGFLIRVCLAQ